MIGLLLLTALVVALLAPAAGAGEDKLITNENYIVVVQPPWDDGDTIPRNFDNCPDNANGRQHDFDGDGRGNVCDGDDDNDGWPDWADPYPWDPTRPGYAYPD